MVVKKSGGRIFGAALSKNEQKALDIEIGRQCAEWDTKHANEISAMVMIVLHDEFGFGIGRLRRFYEEFGNGIEELVKRYELDSGDALWLCTYRLKEELGIDIEEWNK